MFVSVYGTLKAGYGNNRLLKGCELIATGIARNVKLFTVGGFPVATNSEGDSATVEVYKLPDDTWRDYVHSLDGLEGHRGNSNPSSMYQRHETTIHGDDGETYQAEMYFGNPPYWKDFAGMRECPNVDRTFTWSR